MILRHIKKSIFLLTTILVLFTGCSKDFLDINEDPNNPTEVSVATLLPRAEQYVAFSLGYSRGTVEVGLSEVLAVYTHQMVVREDADQYGANGTEFNINGAWDSFYSNALPDLNAIIAQGTTQGNMTYVGIAKILKAYAFSQFVDTFGDVPFSEAARFSEGITYAKFDDDAAIYPQLIAMLDQGIADLNNTSAANSLKPGANDLIYGGNKANWIKAANTIKLKLYNQLRLVRNVTPEVTALLATPANLINSTAEGLMYYFGPGITPDDRNPAFQDYVATQKSRYISPWFYEIMKGYNQEILTNNPDPRIPYYWYRQIKPTASTAFNTEYRDGGFVSVLFGSVGVNRDWSTDNYMTVFGLYPAGGRYDDGGGTTVDGSSGTGAAPFKFITYADRLYIEAELINAGVIPGNERAKLEEAMVESFKQVDYIANKAKLASQTVPALSGSAAVTTYIDKVLTEFDAQTSAAGRLELIMTQKWIASFGSHVDQYTDYRRTGYPVLFDPNNNTHAPGGMFQPPIAGNPTLSVDQPKVPVQLTRAYPLSLPWSQDELQTNTNAPAQKQPSSYKVFWDN
jgi:hypothetical protein